ncbi:NACHT domain protein [Colletotrichum sojae]|uniref:NACHT domain protein n=1 Tax=Colletotrichum sojae TaxID=2175907 RepID=A0A8H6JLT8_9PEZI|nr:NACHT domain protein [Colletotrichum sojae]
MATNGYDPVQQAFESAKRDFKSSLKQEELYRQILETTSIEQVYDATDKLQNEQAKKGHLRNVSKIDGYLNRLREYAGVVEWANVLKQSFDAIVDAIEEIGILLPEFTEMTRIFGDNARIQEMLVLFKDILDFYLATLKFFSSSRLTFVFEALWPGRREKIKMVGKLIKQHALLLRNKVQWSDIREAHEARHRQMEHFQLTERALMEQEYNSIRTHVSPKSYDDDLNRLQSSICPGTGNWLLRDKVFRGWMDRSCAVLIANPVAQGDSGIRKQDLRNNLDLAVGLFESLLRCAGLVYIVIDGVDEIEEKERSRLLEQLLRVSKSCQDCRILLSSRSESDLIAILKDDTVKIEVHHRNSGGVQVLRQPPHGSAVSGESLRSRIPSRNRTLVGTTRTYRKRYGRIFNKVNQTVTLKDKARRILGWICCAPSPLTRREIEHALLIDPEDTDGEARVVSVLDVFRVCGPILEVVDDYVQFVHFTAKEYILDEKTSDRIVLSAATLSLTERCITYLGQAHHDPELPVKEVGFNLRSGAYRFHDFATLFWLELLKRFLVLNETNKLPEDLVDGLKNLYSERYLCESQASAENQGSKEGFDIIDPQHAHFQQMLESVSGFQKIADNADYQLGKGPTMNLLAHAQPFSTTAG